MLAYVSRETTPGGHAYPVLNALYGHIQNLEKDKTVSDYITAYTLTRVKALFEERNQQPVRHLLVDIIS